MNRNHLPGLLLGGAICVAAAALAIAARGLAGPQLLAATPLVLLLPGLAVTSAAFGPGRLGFAERALFSLGGSLCLAVLGGLLLHLTPWGLRPASWVGLLGGITVVAGAFALVRWRDRPAPRAAPLSGGGLNAAQATLCLLAATVLAGSLFLSVRGAQGQAAVGFTQLWIVDSSTEGGASVRFGLRNQESAATQFRLQFEVDGRLRRTWNLALDPQQDWEETIALPEGLSPTARVEAVLYRADSPNSVYRRVVLQRGQQ